MATVTPLSYSNATGDWLQQVNECYSIVLVEKSFSQSLLSMGFSHCVRKANGWKPQVLLYETKGVSYF